MPRFFTGDVLGALKAINYTQGYDSKEWKAQSTTLLSDAVEEKPNAIQKLAISRVDSKSLIAAAHSDGFVYVRTVDSTAVSAEPLHEWKETRLKPEQRYIGLAISGRRVFSCTSNGALRSIVLPHEDVDASTHTAALPMRLFDWRMSSNAETFAYGGDEVELSVWSTEAAFTRRDEASNSNETRKRKRGEQLLPGEVWRAKNVPNDGLSLRRPVHITALTYLQPSPSASHHHLLTGTQAGNVRRYDTRAARRPVADWKGIGKVGGVSIVERGLSENEVFVADRGCNLFALDMRTGRVVYGYKGLAGAITSIAPSPSLLASVSQDRFLRLHSTFPPPSQAGGQQEHKGEVSDKFYMKTIPTVVIWDQAAEGLQVQPPANYRDDDENEADDDMWDNMENVGDNEGAEMIDGAKRSRIAE